MKGIIRASLLVALAAALAAGCSKIGPITAPALSSGSANFSVVAALGTSISAGYQSSGLVDRHQTRSYVSLFAQQVGARTLDLPLMGSPGIPPLLALVRLLPPPVIIAAPAVPPGTPLNALLPTAYHNMGIPGALILDASDTSSYQLPARNNPYFTLIQRGRGSVARQIATQLSPAPTFLLFEYGSNEVLGPATRGTVAGLTPGANFAVLVTRALDTLSTLLPNARMAVLNVPDVTSIPFFTTLSNKVLDAAGNPVLNPSGSPRFLLGPGNNPLIPGDLVLLKASTQLAAGIGYPTGTTSYVSGLPVPGTGIGLHDSLVLSAGETSVIAAEVRRYNTILDTASARRGHAVVDIRGLLARAATTGVDIRGSNYNSRFVTGGIFSLDGVHPNDLAHALVCNEVIAAVNAKFGSNIQPLDPTKFGTLTASRARAPAREDEPTPYLPQSGALLDGLFPRLPAPLP